MLSPQDSAFAIRLIEQTTRDQAAMAAKAVMLRLNQLEAGQPVAPLDYARLRRGPGEPDPHNPRQAEVDRAMAPFLTAMMEAIADELDDLTPRVRALIAARPKPRVRAEQEAGDDDDR